MKDFIKFIREKGVVGLAVGIIVGGAVTKLVTSLIDNLISPFIGFITGVAGNLSSLIYTVPGTGIIFKWGAFLSSVIDFTVVVLVVYVLFIKSPLNKIDNKKD
jgi:large conductance mechanosensitive channel